MNYFFKWMTIEFIGFSSCIKILIYQFYQEKRIIICYIALNHIRSKEVIEKAYSIS